jgi:hypothetical protein
MAGWTGLEPATSCVTGRRSNRLNYHPNGESEVKILERGEGLHRTIQRTW